MNRRQLLPLCLALSLTGCGSRGPALPDAYPAKGQVLLAGGAPVAGGRITFAPKDPHRGIEAWGEIQPDGGFTLTTYKLNDGAVPGEYVVTLSPYSYKTGNLKVANAGRVPQRYAEAATSGLTVEVKPEENFFRLRLEER
jgi:hypothetical protein